MQKFLSRLIWLADLPDTPGMGATARYAAQLNPDLVKPCVLYPISGETNVDLMSLWRQSRWRVCSGREEVQAEERG